MSQAWKSVESSQVKNDKSHVSNQKWKVPWKIKSDKSKDMVRQIMNDGIFCGQKT